MPYSGASSIQRPSEQLADLMSGRLAWVDAPASIQSWAGFHIYLAARQIASESDKGTRRNMLGRVPPHMRGMVGDEVKRLWAIRKR